MSARAFDAIIIGAGQAGPSLAGRLNDAGMTVAIIERHLVGGTCVKHRMQADQDADCERLCRSQRHGAVENMASQSTGRSKSPCPAVAARARKVIMDSRAGNESWLAGMANVELIRGHARFVGPNIVEVDGERLAAPRIFINVGGRAIVPDMPGVEDVTVLTNTDMGGARGVARGISSSSAAAIIGLEFAQMYRRFGAEVTIVERMDRLIAREDPDISEEVRAILEREGIIVRTGADCIGFARHESGIAVSVDCAEESEPVIGSHVLMAVGRRPNTDDLGIDAAGIMTDGRGYITVDDQLQTNVPGVYALGDCNGRGAFTHTAYNDFEIVAANLLDGESRRLSQRLAGYALYIDPPLGRIGMTEAEAARSGRRLLHAKRR